jgi:hypothetical protein
MSATLLQEFTAKFKQLTLAEQQWLLDRLAADLRRNNVQKLEIELAAMAADPDIRRELRAIEEEFAHTESDGLESI